MLIRRIARPLLSVAFIGQGVDALRNPKPAADAARPALDGMRQLPDPIGPKVPSNAETFARANAAVQVGGGLLLATGKLPRLASAALAFTVIPGSVGGHMFWNEADPQRKADERRAFMTDLSLLGGLIIAAVDTEGKPSLGWRGRRAARKVSEAVSSALPVGAASGGALADSAFAEKLGHGLQVGAERGREFAHVARERGAELAEVARERAPEIAEAARGRAAEFAEVRPRARTRDRRSRPRACSGVRRCRARTSTRVRRRGAGTRRGRARPGRRPCGDHAETGEETDQETAPPLELSHAASASRSVDWATMTTDPAQGPYGSDPRGYPPPFPANLEPGGLVVRFLARLIDGILVGIVSLLLFLVTDTLSNYWVTGLFTGLLTFIYFLAFEITQGWTPGKKLLGLRVHGPGGAPKPTAQQSAIRNAWTLFPIIPIIGGLLGFIAIIVIAVTINGSPTKQGKHDELAGGTQVVKG